MPQQPSVTIPGKMRLCTPCGAGVRSEGFGAALVPVPASVLLTAFDLGLLAVVDALDAPVAFCVEVRAVLFLRCFTFGMAYIQFPYYFCWFVERDWSSAGTPVDDSPVYFEVS
jgi:hypothetical protein